MQEIMKKRAKELLKDKTVSRVLGWKKGEFAYDCTPGVFYTEQEIEEQFIYNELCQSNLSKYLIQESRKEGKVLVFLKPCDTYSFNQLMKEHRLIRENIYILAVSCEDKIDIDTIKAKGIEGILDITCEKDEVKIHTLYGEEILAKKEAMNDRCLTCKSKKHVIFDELLGEEGEALDSNRFDMVEKIEQMTSEERFAFWQGELSRCIRCNACRNVCPACSCETCVFDNPASGVENKAAANSFEENMFHIIRAFHVAGRCTDCGECSRVCPQNIPLHLINRKIIKDINEFYGEYQAGEDETLPPLNTFTKGDVEPGAVYMKGGESK